MASKDQPRVNHPGIEPIEIRVGVVFRFFDNRTVTHSSASIVKIHLDAHPHTSSTDLCNLSHRRASLLADFTRLYRPRTPPARGILGVEYHWLKR